MYGSNYFGQAYFGQGYAVSAAQETVTSDKWGNQSPVPQSNWAKAKQYSVAAIMPFLFFVQLPPAAQVINN